MRISEISIETISCGTSNFSRVQVFMTHRLIPSNTEWLLWGRHSHVYRYKKIFKTKQ